MSTATERAIAAREKRSREAAKKRGIGKYADGYVGIEADEDEAEPDEKPAKASKAKA